MVEQRLKDLDLQSNVIFPAIHDFRLKRTAALDASVKIVPELAPGTIVFALDHTRTSKWNPIFEGPFKVVRNEGGAYVLQDQTGELLEKKYNIEMLKVLPSDPILAGRKEISNFDNSENEAIAEFSTGKFCNGEKATKKQKEESSILRCS